MTPAANTSFDVAFWFLDRARSEDTYLQPRALQCLLFLAQAHYAAAYGGRRLMPSVFVMDHAGPLDPNLYRMLENGRPEVTAFPLNEATLVFMDAIWRRYCKDDALRLEQIISRAGEGEKAVNIRKGAEISTAAMCRMFGTAGTADKSRMSLPSKENPGSMPAVIEKAAPEMPVGPNGLRVMKTHTGRKVTVKSWAPARKIVSG